MGYFFIYSNITPDEVSLSGFSAGKKVYQEPWQISKAQKKEAMPKSKYTYRISDATPVYEKSRRHWTKSSVDPINIEVFDYDTWTPVDELYPRDIFELRKTDLK